MRVARTPLSIQLPNLPPYALQPFLNLIGQITHRDPLGVFQSLVPSAATNRDIHSGRHHGQSADHRRRDCGGSESEAVGLTLDVL